MLSLLFAGLIFAATAAAAMRSLLGGILAVVTVGYFYGIGRANVPGPLGHFYFDLAIAALYVGQLRRPVLKAGDIGRLRQLQFWLFALIIWPLLLLLVPVQPLGVSLVGFRGSVYFLPAILLGARLTSRDLSAFGDWLAKLNIIVLGVALGEFFLGLEPFLPLNEVTMLNYLSADVGESNAFRIPGTFSSAHAYAGTMVASLPFVIGAWADGRGHQRLIALLGVFAASLGVFLSATRQHFLMLMIVLLAANFGIRLRRSHRLSMALAVLALAAVVSQSERLQRFAELNDKEMISARIHASTGRVSFWQIAKMYPMGNGLGGGGTNMPYFLASQVRNQQYIENEYGRIMLEQGVIGVLLWVGFLVWVFRGSRKAQSRAWRVGRRLAYVCSCAYCATAFIGTGLFVSIPQAFLLMLSIGWLVSGGPWMEREAANPTAPAEPVMQSSYGIT